MPLKTKDGNAYRLRGPNKLSKTQALIDQKQLVFHNCDWEEIRFVEGRPVVEKPPEPVRIEQPNKPIYLEQPKPAPPAKESEAEVFEVPRLNCKTMFHCLPAYHTSHQDDFYGSSWQRLKYGTKFVFPGVMLEKHDLAISLWTTDPNQQITEQSVIFPFAYEIWNKQTQRYDRVPYDEYRWWRVVSIEDKDGGKIYTAAPSDLQPDFSDSV